MAPMQLALKSSSLRSRFSAQHGNTTRASVAAKAGRKPNPVVKLEASGVAAAVGLLSLASLAGGAGAAEEAAAASSGSFARASAALQQAAGAIYEVASGLTGEQAPLAAAKEAIAQPQAAVAEVVGSLASSLQAPAPKEAAAAVQQAAQPALDALTATKPALDAVTATPALQSVAQLAAAEVPAPAQAAVAQQAPAMADAAASLQDTVQPAIAQAAAAVQGLAQPAISAAEPVLKASLEGVQKSLNVDPAALSATTEAASSFSKQAIDFLTSTDPARLGEDALALVAIAYGVPPLAGASLKALRGYAGEVLPTTALDNLVSQGGNVLVDIRPAKEKESVGVPDLPDQGKLVELEYVAVGDDRLTSRLRNALDVEAELTAVEIAALKKVNKGTTMYLMGSNGSMCKSVAKELGRRGFGKVYIVSGGYQAWSNAKLRTKPWSPAAALLPPKAASASA
ncbi:hypothetical protein N2152v2_005604 [Parachlorella kessleri]